MLQEKTYFDVVSVKDELPDTANRYGVNYEEFQDIPESDYWDGEKFTDHIGKRKLTITHWLKEKKGYLLSKEELIDLLIGYLKEQAHEELNYSVQYYEETASEFITTHHLK